MASSFCFQSPWQRALFVYGSITAGQKKNLEKNLKGLFQEGWRLVPLKTDLHNELWALGKIIEKLPLEALLSTQEHIHSCFRLWNLSQERPQIYIGLWLDEELGT